MTAFVDTSAIYAVLDRDDDSHIAAKATWHTLLQRGTKLVTTNYVLLETAALLQNRIGIASVRALREGVVPLLEVEWIGESRHAAGVEAVLSANRRKLSMVDCVRFQVMRQHRIQAAFCFDPHFADQGFITKLSAIPVN